MRQREGSREVEGSSDEEIRASRESISGGDASGQLGVQESSALSLDDAFDILSNQRRRHVLLYLLRGGSESAELGELAEYVAARENDKDRSAVTSTERKRVYVGLYQNHLPRMDAVDVIEFDADRKQIQAGTHATDLADYLSKGRLPRGGKDDWARYYLLVAICGGLAVLASVLTSGHLAGLGLVVVAGTIACFLVLSVAQLYYHYNRR